MQRLVLFVLLLSLAAADVAAVRAGLLPGWCFAVAAVLGLAAVIVAVRAVIEGTRHCQLCERPLTDRRAAGEYALKYGIRACGDCGPKLDERFGDEDPVVRPPYPPGFP